MSHFNMLETAEAVSAEQDVDTNTVLKELIQYEILAALSGSCASKSMVLQGGSALRLFYGSPRHSEDLDFVAGAHDVFSAMEEFKNPLLPSMAERYGLSVRFKDPKMERSPDGLHVYRWTAAVALPRKDLSLPQVQKIRIELVGVPSYENQLRPIRGHYAPTDQETRVRVSSLQEIFADKVLAVVNRPWQKSRDVWDLAWLLERGLRPDPSLIKRKLVDYGESSCFQSNLATRIRFLEGYNGHIGRGLARFFGGNMRERMLEDAAQKPMVHSVAECLRGVEQALAESRPDSDYGQQLPGLGLEP